jgi:hypothetical protein
MTSRKGKTMKDQVQKELLRDYFFKTCIARFSLTRGEQSGNKAKTEGSTKYKNTKKQKTKLTKQSTTTK